jgi:sulfur-oxidizing protein SoxZ
MTSHAPPPKPRVRLDRKEVKKGELIEVKSLISHVMESGQRRDAAGNVVPRKIINKFTAELNGKLVFAADMEPAVSANPYMQFKFRPEESGTIKFTWIDDDGTRITAEEKITVTS